MEGVLDDFLEFRVGLGDGHLGFSVDEGLRRAEENTDVCGLEHGAIVPRIPSGDDTKIQGLEGANSFAFLVGLAELVIENCAG